ncbi:uncharacterized protein KY384_007304 [Bacidia gigantensis]|uniref:uncharacterized protein n=1 Tax=Bacidia gigantensis TaxID=2732470 RepID=UPI001D040013|nr:uncharacterized protein KY384_007304 [Bacidia gigantensis]KAG8528386.1 hypothetical protein KY384_007304 [Bacidia gigantensis]
MIMLTSTIATQTLAAQLCSDVYKADPALGTSVAAAVAQASSAATAEESLDPVSEASYPTCAQECHQQSFAGSSIKSLSDLRFCTDTAAQEIGTPCARANCSAPDLYTTAALTFRLCRSVLVKVINTNTTATPTANLTAVPTSSPIAFAGGSSRISGDILMAISLVLGALVISVAV